MRYHHGVISRQEAVNLGLTAGQIDNRVRTGEWLQITRGVYRLAGSPESPLGDLRAAVLAGGPNTVASHDSAAWLWGIADEPAQPAITIPHSRVRRVPGVRVGRTRVLGRVVVRSGIPSTDTLRTILDCAADLRPDKIDKADRTDKAGPRDKTDKIDDLVDRALARRLLRIDDLVRAVEGRGARRRQPGRAILAARLAQRGVTGGPSPSVLESRAARLLAGAGLPAPKAEVAWGPQRRYRLDFAYPALKLAIEVDGSAFHFTPEQQRRDHRRSNALMTAGWTVLRYNWWDITNDGQRVVAEVAAAYRALAA